MGSSEVSSWVNKCGWFILDRFLLRASHQGSEGPWKVISLWFCWVNLPPEACHWISLTTPPLLGFLQFLEPINPSPWKALPPSILTVGRSAHSRSLPKEESEELPFPWNGSHCKMICVQNIFPSLSLPVFCFLCFVAFMLHYSKGSMLHNAPSALRSITLLLCGTVRVCFCFWKLFAIRESKRQHLKK